MGNFQYTNKHVLQIKKLLPDARIPSRGSDSSAGYDLHAMSPGIIAPRSHAIIRTGISIQMPILQGITMVGLIKSRSGLSAMKGIEHGAGVIDQDYTGEIKVVLHNHSETEFKYYKYDRIAQLIILPCLTPEIHEVGEITETNRGENGFGSTG
jgi:dUTP pyrophosphatase